MDDDDQPDEITNALKTRVEASLDRIDELMAKMTAMARAVTAANNAAAAKLDAATAEGHREKATRTAILEEVATTIDDFATRFAKLVSRFESEVAELDAAATMWLDRPIDAGDSLLARLIKTGDNANALAAQEQRVVSQLDLISEWAPLRRAVGRRAANLERLGLACEALAAVGERATGSYQP